MRPELSVLDSTAPGGRRNLVTAAKGAPNLGFSELVEAAFPVLGEEWRLLVDDVPLERRRRGDTDCWVWSPGFYAGTVRADLIYGDDRNGIEFLLDVAPDPGKVGQIQFRDMVREVWAFDASLVLGDEAAATEIGESGDREDAAVRYMRLARYADALVKSLASIAGQPHRTLRSARRHVLLHRVRRADVQTALVAMAGQTAALFSNDPENSEGGVSGGQPLFDVPVSEETFDSAANRTMAALLVQVVIAIDEVTSAMDVRLRSEADEKARHDLAQRWPRRERVLRELRESVKRVLGRQPFVSVRRREVTAAGLTAISAHPLYARTQQLIWRMTRPGYEGGRIDEWSAMSPTWAIYESWCFAAIAAHLEERWADWRWTRANPQEGRYCVTGRSGSRELRLYLQQSFSYSSPPKFCLWSVSSHLIPDIVLVMSDGEHSSMVVLDAKYRRGRQNVLDGMRSAHLYRDALRLWDSPPEMSLLLIPAAAENAEWTMEPDFRRIHRVGAVVLSPDHRVFDPIDGVLEEFFGVSGTRTDRV